MRSLPVGLLLLLLLSHCGGSPATGEAKSASDAASDGDSASESSGEGSDDEDGSASGVAESKPKGPSCDDGTCSLCGSGICPAGWYCDENASGGAACSWLTECADKPSCSCVTRVLGSSCKCREEGGGLKVSCG